MPDNLINFPGVKDPDAEKIIPPEVMELLGILNITQEEGPKLGAIFNGYMKYGPGVLCSLILEALNYLEDDEEYHHTLVGLNIATKQMLEDIEEED